MTSVDFWVSYIVQYYDLNFKESWEILREKNYISRIADRLDYAEEDTRKKIQLLVKEMNEYAEKLLC